MELIDVGRRFETSPPVVALDRISVRVDPGDYVGILGPSGSGKSTLLNLMGLLDRPTSGSYVLDGVDTADLSDQELARARALRIGFVFQAFHLLDRRTIEENVELAGRYQGLTRRDRHARARVALAAVGLSHRLGFTPSTLSGGERQRVALARALAARPSLLLCDEPTGNLDSETTRRVLDLVQAIRTPDIAIVVITHDPTVAERTERVIRLLDGRMET